MARSRPRRSPPAPLAALLVTTIAMFTPAAAHAEVPCVERVLVLGAMPLEVQPLLYAATVDPADTVRVDERTFFVGELAGHDVVLAMTGIGLVNTEQTIAAAFEHFTCGISAVLFSGVAGSRHLIGDVVIPDRWTLDGGATWFDADPGMLAAAADLAPPELARTVPVGDDACACPGVETVDTPVTLEHQPTLRIGGNGTSGDTFGGKPLPCVPGGGDTFGCQVCLAPGATAEDTANFAVNAPSFASPDFFTDFFQPPAETTETFDSQDMESAAAARSAAARGVPFLAVRAVSDGEGDPLMLPGFPVQFFAYRHLAGNNAAAVTIDVLGAWVPATGSTSDAPVGPAAPTTPTSDPGPVPTGAPLPATGGGMLGLLGGALALGTALRRR